MAHFPPEKALALAMAMHRAGKLADAEGIYRQLISRHPNNASALEALGVLLLQTKRGQSAGAMLKRAVEIEPCRASHHVNLAECFRRSGQYESAIAALRRAVEISPELSVAYNNLGIALVESGESEAAISSYDRAIALQPDYAEAHANLANALSDAHQYDAALAAADRAIALRPGFAAGHNSRGVSLAALARFDEAVIAYERAISLDPAYADAYSNLGNSLAQIGDHAKALVALATSVQIDPSAVQPHWNYAVELLRAGNLEQGWAEYEWRWKKQDKFPRPRQRFHPARFQGAHWAGEPIAGRTILLHAEQGFGDAIHFVRYAPLVAAMGAKVVIESHDELRRLFESIPGVEQVIARGAPLPAVDAHCPFMSLPLALRTEVNTIPGATPYLHAAPDAIAQWAERLAALEPKPAATDPPGRLLRVGLCWAGSPKHSDDADRSISLSMLAPLADSHVTFVSLQKGPARDQAAHVPAAMRLIDVTDDLVDFADSAALIENLDLVITVDTAVAHLAGALGKPVWVMMRRVADWRWLINRRDTPWYPTMRLFRQTSRGDWGPVVAGVARELHRVAGLGQL